MRQGLAAALESDYASALRTEAENQQIAGDSEDAREGRDILPAKTQGGV